MNKQNKKGNLTQTRTEIPKIFESPDKGKTVYERDFGAPHNTRKMIMKDGVKIDER